MTLLTFRECGNKFFYAENHRRELSMPGRPETTNKARLTRRGDRVPAPARDGSARISRNQLPFCPCYLWHYLLPFLYMPTRPPANTRTASNYDDGETHTNLFASRSSSGSL